VACGDAAEVFEFGEELFDAVAFAMEMLVKGRFLGSARVQGHKSETLAPVRIKPRG